MKSFAFKGTKIRLARVGPANMKRQRHYSKSVNAISLKKDGGDRGEQNLPPAKRGMWCFPWLFGDDFFYHHVYERLLPKKYLGDPPEDASSANDFFRERDLLLESIKHREKIKTIWWGGSFWSKIYNNTTPKNGWYYWSCPKQWAKQASKDLYLIDLSGGQIKRVPYSVDHLEIFIEG